MSLVLAHHVYRQLPLFLRRPSKRIMTFLLFILAWVYPLVANKK